MGFELNNTSVRSSFQCRSHVQIIGCVLELYWSKAKGMTMRRVDFCALYTRLDSFLENDSEDLGRKKKWKKDFSRMLRTFGNGSKKKEKKEKKEEEKKEKTAQFPTQLRF
ncbi:hypothetical protein HJC23_007642 [Cyclotella cryptica]|uniref:Uncharacterized protein n=1 Tax=Cyclotella cryptica TaxID=29204 RepID=A0ABD3QRM5_9STRA